MAQYTVRLDDQLAKEITKNNPYCGGSRRNVFLVELLKLGLMTFQEDRYEQAKSQDASA